MSETYARLLGVAELVARRAGEVIRAAWDEPREVEEKGAADLVTQVDRRSEALIREQLALHTPGVGVLGEEGGADGADGEPRRGRWWYVDPVDGTTNLAHGIDHVAVSIALVEDARPLVGVVYNPIQEKLFRAARGQGATLNGRRLGVSSRGAIGQAVLGTGFPTGHEADPSRNNLAFFCALSPRARAMRRMGSAALDLAAVAAGWLDGFWEGGLHAWDVAAGWLLVEEAGGRVSAFDGGPFDPLGVECLASNGVLHDALVEALVTTRGGQG